MLLHLRRVQIVTVTGEAKDVARCRRREGWRTVGGYVVDHPNKPLAGDYQLPRSLHQRAVTRFQMHPADHEVPARLWSNRVFLTQEPSRRINEDHILGQLGVLDGRNGLMLK